MCFWNPAAERLFGWSEAEVFGRSYPLVPPDRQDEFRAHHRGVLRGESFADIETQRQRHDGSVVVAPILGTAGRVDLIMMTLADISRRKRIEAELRAANEAKDDFLATVSHELRSAGRAGGAGRGGDAAGRRNALSDRLARSGKRLAPVIVATLPPKRFERRLCRRNFSWGEVRKGGEAPLRGRS